MPEPDAPDDRGQLAGFDLEVEPLQGLHLDALGGEDPHQVDTADLRGHSVPILILEPGLLRRATLVAIAAARAVAPRRRPRCPP